jgi:hypothetical protein
VERHCSVVISGGMVDSTGTTDWRRSCCEIEELDRHDARPSGQGVGRRRLGAGDGEPGVAVARGQRDDEARRVPDDVRVGDDAAAGIEDDSRAEVATRVTSWPGPLPPQAATTAATRRARRRSGA